MFSINENYLARSLLTLVYNRPPRKQKPTHTAINSRAEVTLSRELKAAEGNLHTTDANNLWIKTDRDVFIITHNTLSLYKAFTS